jgi:hypothetical protein
MATDVFRSDQAFATDLPPAESPEGTFVASAPASPASQQEMSVGLHALPGDEFPPAPAYCPIFQTTALRARRSRLMTLSKPSRS